MLIGTSFSDEIHGTSNGKKTGCGVNLLRAGNDTKYRQIGRMNDLKEVTCEKCKEKIAKEMIKADKKEMSRLLKEERARMKAGIEDEGIVPLGNTTARITGTPVTPRTPEPPPAPAPQQAAPVREPEPVRRPEPVQQAPTRTIPGTGVPMDDDLAQFAINAPAPEQPAPAQNNDDDFLAQFAVNAPAPEQPAPAQNNDDDFLAQFAVNAPAPEKPAPAQNNDDDFLAQFAIDPNAQQQSSENDDIMNMFSIGNQPQETIEQLPQDEPSPVQGMYDNDSSVVDVEEQNLTAVNEPQQPQNNAWDIFANQFFGMPGEMPAEPEPEEAPLEMDDMPAVDRQAAPPPVPAPSAPVLDDITPEELSPVLDEVIPPAREEFEPELEDIEVPSFDSVIPPANEDIAPPELDEIEVPEVPDFYGSQAQEENIPESDDISIPDFEDVAVSEPVQPAPVQQPKSAPVQQPKPAPVQQPAPAPVQQPAPAPVQQPAPAPVQYQQPAPAPVQQPAPAPVQYQQPAPAPVQYQQPAPAPVQYQQPAPAPVQYQQPAVGQFMTVPTGYDQNGQPIYAYMQITGYDMNGQPILAPVAPPTGMPVPNMQPQFATPMQSPVSAPKFGSSSPTPSKYGKAGLTPGQKIAAEAAAKGNMMDANISKIATNPHSKSTSNAFIHAISEAKDKANQSLTDTQGLKPSAPVITSIEDMLSQLGDNSEKEKQMKKAAAAKNLPQYEEFTNTSSFSSRSVRPSAPKPKAPKQPDRPLTKKELKELEKQRKIDEKFRKEMEKRKG